MEFANSFKPPQPSGETRREREREKERERGGGKEGGREGERWCQEVKKQGERRPQNLVTKSNKAGLAFEWLVYFHGIRVRIQANIVIAVQLDTAHFFHIG